MTHLSIGALSLLGFYSDDSTAVSRESSSTTLVGANDLMFPRNCFDGFCFLLAPSLIIITIVALFRFL